MKTKLYRKIWPIAAVLIGAAAIILFARSPEQGPSARVVEDDASMRTVVLLASGTTSMHEDGIVPVTLIRGSMPVNGGIARVLTDEDCLPDENGISHCLNRIAVGRTEVTLRHDHDMRSQPCLRPGELVRISKAG
jgi:hypothetical protein